MSLVIDAERFLFLTAALSTACGPVAAASKEPASGDDKAANVDTTESSSTAASFGPEETPPAEAVDSQAEEAPDAPSKAARARKARQALACRDEGEVSCDFVDARFVGPACEGFLGSCVMMQKGHGFHRAVASEIARCYEQEGSAACNIFVRKRCIRASLIAGCADETFRGECEQAVNRCKAQNQRPDFTVAECVSTLSNLKGGELEWAREAMGPSREGCKLMFPVY